MSATVDMTCKSPECAHKGTYPMECHCDNCGFSGNAVFTQGHEALGGKECPVCKTFRLNFRYPRITL